MLHSFHIPFHLGGRNTHELKKIGQNLMTMADGPGNLLSLGSQDKAAVFFMMEESFRIKTLDHVGHTRLRDTKTSCNVNNPGISLGINKFLDTFEIVFGCRG